MNVFIQKIGSKIPSAVTAGSTSGNSLKLLGLRALDQSSDLTYRLRDCRGQSSEQF